MIIIQHVSVLIVLFIQFCIVQRCKQFVYQFYRQFQLVIQQCNKPLQHANLSTAHAIRLIIKTSCMHRIATTQHLDTVYQLYCTLLYLCCFILRGMVDPYQPNTSIWSQRFLNYKILVWKLSVSVSHQFAQGPCTVLNYNSML